MSERYSGLTKKWNVFRLHRPVGEYLPVGQLDGDCHVCRTTWPCPTVSAVLDEFLDAEERDLAEYEKNLRE